MILIISFYFPPIQSPGAFRTYELIRVLLEHQSYREKKIYLFTTFTNLKQIRDSKRIILTHKRLKILKFTVPLKGENILNNLINFIVFFFKCYFFSLKLQPILVFGTSGRLGTNLLATIIANSKGVKYVLDIRDLFSLNVKDILLRKFPIFKSLIFNLLIRIEKKMYKNALAINVVSQGFLDFYQSFNIDTKGWTFIPNGIDEIFVQNIDYNYNTNNSPKIVLYAGNLGFGQGLNKFVTSFSKNLPPNWIFKIVGNGNQFNSINNLIEKESLTNTFLSKSIERKKLLKLYKKADVFLIHLNNFECLNYVIPSKSFELGLMKKPIIAGVEGYAAKFLKKEIPNVFTFSPCNGKDAIIALENSLRKKNFSDKKRILLLKNYYRKNLMNKYIELILKKWNI